MKIIIAGDGKLGSSLTRQLAAEGHDLTLIDANPQVLGSSEERYDIMVVQGNCASMDVLLQAGVKETALLIAVAGADEVNLLCCMTAYGLNPNIHTIARVRNPEYTDQIYQMREMFGLSMAVNPERQVAVEIERYREEREITRINAVIYCEKKSHKGMIIGKGGRKLKGIGKSAREEIEALLGVKVYLELWVKVKENWRDSDIALSNFGYKDQV